MTDERKPIQTVSELTERQRQVLIADLLDFFETEPEYPEARPIRDLAGDPRFDAYSMSVLKEMTRSMTRSGSLYRPPQTAGRNSRYLTTREGREMKDAILHKLRG